MKRNWRNHESEEKSHAREVEFIVMKNVAFDHNVWTMARAWTKLDAQEQNGANVYQ